MSLLEVRLHLSVLSLLVVATGAPAGVVDSLNPTAVTDTLVTEGVVFGFCAEGGGYINHLSIPGVSGGQNLVARGFGRGWQAAIRDKLHSGKHNPTQAGYRDGAGAPATLVRVSGTPRFGTRIHVQPFVAPLFANPLFDFTEYEELYPDNFPAGVDGDSTDTDNLPEIGGSQESEIAGEFDFSAVYEDVSGKVNLGVPVLRKVYRFDWVRGADPIRQFGPQAQTVNGDSVFVSNAAVNDISPSVYPGAQVPTPTDYSFVINAFSLRIRWTEGFRTVMWVDSSGVWQSDSVIVCNVTKKIRVFGDDNLDLYDGNPDQFLGGNPANFLGTTDRSFLVLSTGTDPDTSHAVGVYYPATSPCNAAGVAGVRTATGDIEYVENRRMRVTLAATRRACGYDPPPGGETKTINGQYVVEDDLTSLAVHAYLSGILAPEHLPVGIHERLRQDVYLIVGTPNEIRMASGALEALDPSDSGCETAVEATDAGPVPRPAGQGPELFPVAPNPTGDPSRIVFRVAGRGRVRLTVHDATGRLVATLLDGVRNAGTGSVSWDGRDASGAEVASGIYFARLESAGSVRTRKITVLR